MEIVKHTFFVTMNFDPLYVGSNEKFFTIFFSKIVLQVNFHVTPFVFFDTSKTF